MPTGAARPTVRWRAGFWRSVVFVLSVALLFLLLLLVDERFLTTTADEQQQHESTAPAAAYHWNDNAYFYGQLQRQYDWPAVARYALEWKHAVIQAARDNARAVTSTGTALIWTLQPFLWLTVWLLRVVLQDFVYDIVLVRGICSETALRQAKLVLQRIVAWQRQLTARQVAAEVGVLISVVVLYRLYQFLQRRQYGTRLQRRLRAVRQSIAKSYSTALQRLAATSRCLAILFPYAVLAAGSLALKCSVPRAVTWWAVETQLVNALSRLYPLVVSILLLHDALQRKQEQKPEGKNHPLGDVTNTNHSTTASSTLSKTKKMLTRLTVKQDRERRQQEHEQKLKEELAQQRHLYWIHYWMVSACVAALHRVWRILPLWATLTPQWVVTAGAEVALFFWIALNAAPYMTPASLRAPNPVDYLAQHWIVFPCTAIVKVVAGFPPQHVWETYCCAPAERLLQILTWSKLFSEHTANAMQHWIQESRGLITPAFCMFSWPLQAYGLLYVQYVLPLSQSLSDNPNKTDRWLQFWVVHCVLSAVVYSLGSFLWWIPLSNVALFAVWATLTTATDSHMEFVYRNYIQRELQALSLLPPHDVDSHLMKTDQSRMMQAFYWILKRLPRAKDAQPPPPPPTKDPLGGKVTTNDEALVAKRATPVDPQDDVSETSMGDGEGDAAAGAGVSPKTRPRSEHMDDECSSSSNNNNSENASVAHRKSLSRPTASQKATLHHGTRRRTASVRD